MTDRNSKVMRTREMILDVIRELTIEIGISNITILNIAKRAGINRSTFYLHFSNKEESIRVMREELLEEFRESLQDGDLVDINQAYKNYYKHNKPYYEAIKLFSHINNYSELYKILTLDQGFQILMNEVLLTHIRQFNKKDSVLSFFSYGIIGLIQYWLKNGMKESIEEISLELTNITIDIAVKKE